MGSIAQAAAQTSLEPIKAIVVGESGTGKTGGLASLAADGYNVRIIDLDNNIAILKDLAVNKYPSGTAERIYFATLSEKMKFADGKAYPATATVWDRMVGLMKDWKFDGDAFGPLESWTQNDVLVIDTLTAMGTAAYNKICALNQKLLNRPTGNIRMQYIYQAQDAITEVLIGLASSEIKCNIIINSHINYQDEPGYIKQDQNDKAPLVGFPTVLGRALGPTVPRLYGSVLLAKKEGLSHKLFTRTASNIHVKTSAPSKVEQSYPIEKGLSSYFKALRGTTPNDQQ